MSENGNYRWGNALVRIGVNGLRIYQEEYSEDNADIVVEGTFEIYKEEGAPNLYCRLSDVILQQKS